MRILKVAIMSIVSFMLAGTTANADASWGKYADVNCPSITINETLHPNADGTFSIDKMGVTGNIDRRGNVLNAIYKGNHLGLKDMAYINKSMCTLAWVKKISPLNISRCPTMNAAQMIHGGYSAGTFVVSDNKGKRMLATGHITDQNMFWIDRFTIEGKGRRIVTDPLRTQQMVNTFCQAAASAK